MCVIVIKPPNTSIKREHLEAMYKQNPHGVGISYYDPTLNKIKWVKGLTDQDEIFKIVEDLYPIEAIIHFRYATCGPINKEMCHPFPISEENALSGESDAIFFHNGEIKSFEPTDPNAEYSDAYLFWKQIINKVDLPLSEQIKNLFDDGINKIVIHSVDDGIDTVGEFFPWNGLKVSNLKFTRFLFEKTKVRKILSFCKRMTLKVLNGIIGGFTWIKEKIE